MNSWSNLALISSNNVSISQQNLLSYDLLIVPVQKSIVLLLLSGYNNVLDNEVTKPVGCIYKCLVFILSPF